MAERRVDEFPFYLTQIESGDHGKSSVWRSTIDAESLGGRFRIMQRPKKSTTGPCADWNKSEPLIIEAVTDVDVTVCMPPGYVMAAEATTYWSTVEWTDDPTKLSWLKP